MFSDTQEVNLWILLSRNVWFKEIRGLGTTAFYTFKFVKHYLMMNSWRYLTEPEDQSNYNNLNTL
jgi:hypothetical protein